MIIIELPFKKKQIVEFEDKYYQIFYAGLNPKCDNCGLEVEDCTNFQIKCGSNIKFKKVKKPNDKNYIKLPFGNDCIFKYGDNYYKRIEKDDNTCGDCCFCNDIECIGNYIHCTYSYFKKLSYYECLFAEEDKNDI